MASVRGGWAALAAVALALCVMGYSWPSTFGGRRRMGVRLLQVVNAAHPLATCVLPDTLPRG
jgi:hypothetical protein